MNGEIGHNQPPDMAETAGEVAKSLSGWMAENPAIQTEDQAREAKVFIDRGSLCIKDLEAERSGKVRPLNEQVKAINDVYRPPRELLERITDELKSRMDRYLLVEEEKRIAAAKEAERIAKEAEAAARQAEQEEQKAYLEANDGVLGLDLADVTANADQAFAEYQRAERQAAIAERETKVKIGGGFSRALSLRKREVVIVDDPIAAIKSIGLENEIITEAIRSAARAYKKLMGKYPEGIRVEVERKI